MRTKNGKKKNNGAGFKKHWRRIAVMLILCLTASAPVQGGEQPEAQRGCVVSAVPSKVRISDDEQKDGSAASGDVDRDGCITASDALLVLRCVVQLVRLDDEEKRLAEVSGDGEIAAADALLILMYVVKLIDDFSEADKVLNGDGVSSPSVCGALHVEGTGLKDEMGRDVQLKGVSTHGIAWFPDYINEECFKQLRTEWKANVVRLAMYTAEYNGYLSGGDQTWLKGLIDKGVTYATNQDMYVIIDWHILSDGNPNPNLTAAKAFFAEMSKKYADHDNVLYEICNEPNGGVSWSEIKAYAEEVIPVIRANDKNAVIIVGTPNWSQYVDQAAADPITGYDNIMYALHFYAATHTDSLRNTMEAAINAGLPVFVTEYGICDASGNGAIDEAQANAWVGLMNHYGISYVAWNLSNKSETSAFFKSSCTKTGGFVKSDLTDSGLWVYKTLTGGNPGTYTPSGNTGSSGGQDSTAGTIASGDAGSLNVSVSLVNSWKSGDESFSQYSLTIENPTQTDISGWSVKLSFSQALSLGSSWCGSFSLSGQSLTITPADYNSTVPAGGSVTDVGFIVSGGGSVTVE